MTRRPQWPSAVTLVEVGPRDGLQNESALVPTLEKVRFIDRLSEAGHRRIEVGAFVRPDRVPGMADTAAVFAALTRRPGTRYSALVPNLKGLERARDAGADEVSVFTATSDTFCRRNINMSVEDSLATYRDVCREAALLHLPVRAYLSTAFGCPFEGPIEPARTAELTARLEDFGVFEVAVSDTIGIAHPGQVFTVLEVLGARTPLATIALHFHDTRGAALANVMAGLEAGVTVFDASAGGLGGCPYAPGATGNLATEDVLFLLSGLGVETGVSLDGVIAASVGIEASVGHPLVSRVYRASRSTRAVS